jgi:hypothetical protein
MTTNEFKKLCSKVVDELRGFAPKDTGNLAYNAIRYEFTSENECKIYVDKDIAPYMPYTNEAWVSAYWQGKKNPNEHWWNNAVGNVIETIKSEYGDK